MWIKTLSRVAPSHPVPPRPAPAQMRAGQGRTRRAAAAAGWRHLQPEQWTWRDLTRRETPLKGQWPRAAPAPSVQQRGGAGRGGQGEAWARGSLRQGC